MNPNPDKDVWPEMADTVSLTDLALACAMSPDDLRELVDFGALQPLEPAQAEPVFAATCMEALRTAGKVRRDYDLDLFVVVIVLDYLHHIRHLEAQLRTLLANAVAPARFETVAFD